MKPVTPTKPVKSQRRPTCGHCKERFRTTSATKSFCTPECQKAAKAIKRKSKNVNDASRSAFFYYLAKECKRAGTLLILHGHTPESLTELHAVYKQAFRVNQYGDVDHFQLSHIAAVKGKNTLGLLHAENLVISPTELNKAHGVKHYGSGKYISRTSINPRHAVDKDEPEGAVLDRLIAYLGESVVAATVKLAGIKPTDRQKNLAWLRDNLDATNPEHAVHIGAIETMKGKQLKELRAEMEHRLVREFGVKRTAHSTFGVLRLELDRHAAYRPELKQLSDQLLAVHESKGHREAWDVQEDEEQALFDLLHGRNVADVQDVLDVLILRNTRLPEVDVNVHDTPDGFERIGDYMPINIPLWAIRTDNVGHTYSTAAPY
ncbi:hypothetical protein [Pseudomonas sp. RIT-PI-q]|uniref:hypothetical protein n=1 Tax=Pseudomonas sp. RIT-PI-q TaxID=1690247 RepID=UPI000A960C5E|nr:hypothetical protein [Pseudomonas sp. RIT-PI-q]